MTDPVPHDTWIDAPYPFAPPTDPPDEVDKALDALADAIARANGGERRSMASHLARTPDRFENRKSPFATDGRAADRLPRTP